MFLCVSTKKADEPKELGCVSKWLTNVDNGKLAKAIEFYLENLINVGNI
jgi:hypothetical protein